jgi:hypothetical protein
MRLRMHGRKKRMIQWKFKARNRRPRVRPASLRFCGECEPRQGEHGSPLVKVGGVKPGQKFVKAGTLDDGANDQWHELIGVIVGPLVIGDAALEMDVRVAAPSVEVAAPPVQDFDFVILARE